MERKFGTEYLEHTALRDGTHVELRLLRPEDKRLLADGLRRMSPESRFFRFFSHRDRLSPHELAYLTELDHENHVAIGAKTFDPAGNEVGLGVARFIRIDPPEIAEAAITVIDDAQGKGLGRVLFERLVAAAHERGVKVFRFDVLAENEPMLKLVEAIFPGSTSSLEDGVVTIDCPLPALDQATGMPPEGALYRVLRHAAEGALRVYRRLQESPSKLLKGTPFSMLVDDTEDDVASDIHVSADDGPAPVADPDDGGATPTDDRADELSPAE